MIDYDTGGRERFGTDGDLGTCDRCHRNLSDPIPVVTVVNGIEKKEWVCPSCEPKAREDEKPPIRADGGTDATVVEQLEERLSELSDQKQDRMEKGDDLGMAYRSGKIMGIIYAIETIEENGNENTETEQ